MNKDKILPEIVGSALGKYAKQYQYAQYKLPCGHLQDIRKQHVKTGSYRCKACLKAQYEEDAQICGLEITEFQPCSDKDYKRYKFIGCGHEKLLTTYAVRNKNIECTDCVDDQRHKDAIRNNLVLMDSKDCSKWTHRDYKYNSCGHVQKMKLQDVSKNKIPKCTQCRELRWKTEANLAGLEFLCISNEDINCCEYLLPCGCTKKFKTGNVRYNKWACDEHSNFWTKPSDIYLIKFTTETKQWLKLGVSTDAKRRILDYKIKCKYDADIIVTKTFETYKEALEFEKLMHKKYKYSNLSHSNMKEYMQNGWSECYDLSLIDVLHKEILQNE